MFDDMFKCKSCNDCRLCCNFYKGQQGPYITSEHKQRIVNTYNPYAQFAPYKTGYTICINKKPYAALDKCPFLTKKGCSLGDNKPLRCKIMPFEVMKLKQNTVITVSPQCLKAFSMTLGEIMTNIDKISPFIFAATETVPDIIVPYKRYYPVIAVNCPD